MMTVNDLQHRAADLQARIWALEDQCDGIGEDECTELVQARAMLRALREVGIEPARAACLTR